MWKILNYASRLKHDCIRFIVLAKKRVINVLLKHSHLLIVLWKPQEEIYNKYKLYLKIRKF